MLPEEAAAARLAEVECLHKPHPTQSSTRNLSLISPCKRQEGPSSTSNSLSWITFLTFDWRIASRHRAMWTNACRKSAKVSLFRVFLFFSFVASDVLVKPMASSVDIYVQITASSSQSSGKLRSVIVLVPRANIDNFRRQKSDSKSDDQSIAKSLAEPLAGYAFTHRTIFSTFELSHSFLTTPPGEIEGRSPNLSQSGLKAWVI